MIQCLSKIQKLLAVFQVRRHATVMPEIKKNGGNYSMSFDYKENPFEIDELTDFAFELVNMSGGDKATNRLRADHGHDFVLMPGLSEDQEVLRNLKGETDVNTSNDMVVLLAHWRLVSQGFVCQGTEDCFISEPTGSTSLPSNFGRVGDGLTSFLVYKKQSECLILRIYPKGSKVELILESESLVAKMDIAIDDKINDLDGNLSDMTQAIDERLLEIVM